MGAQEKQQSVINLFNEMSKAFKDEGVNYNWLISSCKSQSALVKINKERLGIVSMSLNTFKHHSNENVDGGFDAVDSLRKKLYKRSISKKTNKKKRMKKENVSLKNRLDKAIRSRAILVKAYMELNRITLDMMVSTEAGKYDYERHKKLYSDFFKLRLVDVKE